MFHDVSIDLPDDPAISLLAVDQYFRAVRWTSRLTEEEEAKYLTRLLRGAHERLQATPNQWILRLAQDAREHLVEQYQPMVIAVAKRRMRQCTHCEMMDLIQEGNIGLLRALDLFTGTESYCFAAFAHLRITDALRAVTFFKETPLGLPGGAPFRNLRSKFRRFVSDFYNQYSCAPGISEVMEGLQISYQQAFELVRGDNAERAMSLEQVMCFEDGKADKEDFIPLDAQSICEENERQRHLQETFAQVMDRSLTARQKEAITYRFALDEHVSGALTYEEIAQEIGGSSPDLVRSRCEKGLTRLRQVFVPSMKDRAPSCEVAQQEKHYTIAEVAALFGVHRETIRRHMVSTCMTVKRESFSFGQRATLSEQDVETLRASLGRHQPSAEALISARIPPIVA